MNNSFLEYYKLILEKVSFDSNLFIREYKKALYTLKSSEIKELDNWIEEKGFYSSLSRKGGFMQMGDQPRTSIISLKN